MSDGLYEQDALAWSEQQAGLLRRLAAGERVNEAVDWDNLIEEVQDLGLSELRSVRSLLRQALVHLIKLCLAPEAPSAGHWRTEIAGFLTDARDRFAPSMRHRIDIQQVYQDALYGVFGNRVIASKGGADEQPLSRDCPFSLDDLLTARPDIDALVVRLGQP
jgi:hypothetical protein